MQEGTILRNNYRLDRLIGRGGMADVYLAFDMRRQTHVAVKILRDDLAEDPEFVRRFTREAEALARLDHPHIVRFYSFERQGAVAFIVMDFVSGSTLQRRLVENEGPLSLEETAQILTRVGAALQYAHNEGYIHRDVKPANIMLREDGNALLSDFGIARAAESATLTTVSMGTPAYMSPEQILGHELDRRTDIYSLGVVLFEMVTGRRPFTGDERGVTGTSTLARLREAHLKLTPPDPRIFNPNLPAGVATVILRALAKNPADRWPDVLSLLQAWEQAAGRPVRAAAPAVSVGMPTPARRTPPGGTPAEGTPGAGLRTPAGGALVTPAGTPSGVSVAPPPPPSKAAMRPPLWTFLVGAGVLGLAILAVVVWQLAAAGNGGSGSPPPASAAATATSVAPTATIRASETPNVQATVDARVKSTLAAAAQSTQASVGPTATETRRPQQATATLTPARSPTPAPTASFTPSPTATPPPPTSTLAPTPTSAPAQARSACPSWFQYPQPGKGILLIENHIGRPMRVERIHSTETWNMPAKQGDVPGRLLLQLPPGKHEFMVYVDRGEGHITAKIQAGEMWVSPVWFNESREEFIYPLQPPAGC